MNYKHIHNGVVYTLTNQCWDFGSKREHIGVCICGIQSLCWQQQNDLVCIWKHFKVVKIVSTTSYYMQNAKAIPVLLIMTSPWVGQSIYNYYYSACCILYLSTVYTTNLFRWFLTPTDNNADFDVHFVSEYFLVVVIFNLMICWIMPINWLDFFLALSMALLILPYTLLQTFTG